VGEPAQLLLHLIENNTYFLKPPAERRVKFVSHAIHGQAGSKEELSGLIMHGVGDALNFLFQRFIQTTQSQGGVGESAMGHFVRREALAKE
jgi:hypothetical protein